MIKIAIGSDHGGLELKETVISVLKSEYEIDDLGTFTNESCDYPIFASAVAKAVALHQAEFGILICKTGIGVSIVANKVKGIRAALVTNLEQAHLTREHNDANVICLGSMNQTNGQAIELIRVFLNTPFSNLERHINRINQISKIEGVDM